MKLFSYKRKIHYYETDAMGVVHHSNHLRYFEESRVQWFRDRGLDHITWTEEQLYFPLIESAVKYYKPLFFDDDVEVQLQVKQERRRYFFRYGVFLIKSGIDQRGMINPREPLPILCSSGHTVHTLVNKEFRIVKDVSPRITEVMERESWIETWPLNL